MSKCVIAAAGVISDYSAVKKIICEDDYIISADGGIAHLSKLGIKPNIIIGDLDSATGILPEGVEIKRYNKEKDETDTMLAAKYAIDSGYKKIVIIGGTGNRLDHTYANFGTLLYIAKHGCEASMFDSENEIHMLLQGEIKLKKRSGYYISVFPFGIEAEGVTEKGMKYSLNNSTLFNDIPIGVSNEFKDNEALISIKKGPVIIFLSKS